MRIGFGAGIERQVVPFSGAEIHPPETAVRHSATPAALFDGKTQRMRISIVQRRGGFQGDVAFRSVLGKQRPSGEIIGKPFLHLPAERSINISSIHASVLGDGARFEIAVLNQFGIQAAFARVVDVFKEDSPQAIGDAVDRPCDIDGDRGRIRCRRG
jgi:hypothetical protein